MINRLELARAFKALLPGVENDSTASSDIFIFDGKWVKTGNARISISYPFPADTGVSGGVKARELYKILMKMSDESVTLETEEDSISIKDSVTNLRLNIIKDETTDRIIGNKKLQRIEWSKIPDNFLSSIMLCMFSTSPDQNSGIWNTVYVNGKDVVSSDNVRVSWAKLTKKMPDFMLPVASIVEILKMEPTNYFIDSAWAHFQNEKRGIVLSTRLVLGDYPIDDIKALFEKDEESKEYTLPNELSRSLGRVSILSYKDGGYIDLHYDDKDGYLMVKGERDFASITDKIKIPRNSFPAKRHLHVTPEFLTDIMAKTKSFKLIGNVLLFEAERYKHIVALYIK